MTNQNTERPTSIMRTETGADNVFIIRQSHVPVALFDKMNHYLCIQALRIMGMNSLHAEQSVPANQSGWQTINAKVIDAMMNTPINRTQHSIELSNENVITGLVGTHAGSHAQKTANVDLFIATVCNMVMQYIPTSINGPNFVLMRDLPYAKDMCIPPNIMALHNELIIRLQAKILHITICYYEQILALNQKEIILNELVKHTMPAIGEYMQCIYSLLIPTIAITTYAKFYNNASCTEIINACIQVTTNALSDDGAAKYKVALDCAIQDLLSLSTMVNSDTWPQQYKNIYEDQQRKTHLALGIMTQKLSETTVMQSSVYRTLMRDTLGKISDLGNLPLISSNTKMGDMIKRMFYESTGRQISGGRSGNQKHQPHNTDALFGKTSQPNLNHGSQSNANQMYVLDSGFTRAPGLNIRNDKNPTATMQHPQGQFAPTMSGGQPMYGTSLPLSYAPQQMQYGTTQLSQPTQFPMLATNQLIPQGQYATQLPQQSPNMLIGPQFGLQQQQPQQFGLQQQQPQQFGLQQPQSTIPQSMGPMGGTMLPTSGMNCVAPSQGQYDSSMMYGNYPPQQATQMAQAPNNMFSLTAPVPMLGAAYGTK